MAENQPQPREMTDEELAAIGRYALFDQLIDYAHGGGCSVKEAIEEFKHETQPAS